MSTIYGIRIEKKEKNVLTFRVFLIYSDLFQLPRTHGFGYLMLTGNWQKKNPALEETDSNDFCKSVYDLGRKYIRKMEVSDFQNYPLHPDFTKEEWHDLDESTMKFHDEDILPNALYTMEVADEKYISHLDIGDTWETASSDLWGASFYLEHISEKSRKFYHLYRDDVGQWVLNYGKIGTPGQTKHPYMTDEESAELTIKPKLTKAKGYQLVYKNFDTNFGYEREHRDQPVKTAGYEELINAVLNNDIKGISQCINEGVVLDSCVDEHGWPLVHTMTNLMNEGKVELSTFRFLFERSLHPNPLNGMSVAHQVIQSGNEELLRLFLEFGLDMTLEDPGALVCTAAEQGYIWLLELAMKNGVNLKAKTNHPLFVNGLSALHYAVKLGENAGEMIDYLLDKGLDINNLAPGAWGTPLFHAAGRGTKSTVQHLLDKGADLSIKNENGESPLHAAARSGSEEVFILLLDKGCDPFEAKGEGLCPAQLLLQQCLGLTEEITLLSMKKLKILIERGESFERLNQLEVNPLICLETNIMNNKRLQPYEQNIILQLLDMGLDPAQLGKQQRNLLHIAAKLDLVDVVMRCLELGADKNIKDKKGMTPKDYAEKFQSAECLELL